MSKNEQQEWKALSEEIEYARVLQVLTEAAIKRCFKK